MAEIPGFFTWPTFYKDMVDYFPSGSVFVEIGVFHGKSLYFLLDEMEKAGKEFDVIGVDHFNDQSKGLLEEVKSNLKRFEGKYELMIGESTEEAGLFRNKSIDFLFIDAAHDYDSVRDDIKAWLPKVKGIIAGHDYIPTYPGVMKAVDERFRDVNKKYEGCWMVKIMKDE